MRRPIISLFVAVALLVLGGLLIAPVSGSTAVVGPDGQVVRRADGRPRMVADPFQGLRTNWPAYLCLLAGAVSFAWTLFLVAYGVVVVVRAKTQPYAAPNGGPAEPSGNPGACGGPHR
jgi:hypothetical protein